MTKKTDDLLAYFDRLIAAERSEYHCSREIGEVIHEIRKEMELGVYGSLQIARDSTWNILQAAKIEGASWDEIDMFTLDMSENIVDKINELRREGYRIFSVYKPIGVIDDFIKK